MLQISQRLTNYGISLLLQPSGYILHPHFWGKQIVTAHLKISPCPFTDSNHNRTDGFFVVHELLEIFLYKGDSVEGSRMN